MPCHRNNFSFQVLDKYLGKSKNILLLSTVCSKYETECEKVQPFKSSNVIEYDQEKIDDQGGETFKEVHSILLISEFEQKIDVHVFFRF